MMNKKNKKFKPSKNRKKHQDSESTPNIEFNDVDDQEDSDSEDENNVPKWYEQLSDDKPASESLPEDKLVSLRIEAQAVLDEETKRVNLKRPSGRKGSKEAWISTVLKKGTAKDKVAANVVKILNSPIHSISNLTTLVNAVNPAKKKECSIVMETLAELFIEDLLRPNRKLRSFEKQPLANLNELSGGCAKGRRNRLCFWLFEDKLKDLYAHFVNLIAKIAKDTVDANRIKAVSIMYKLLSGHPEQEQVLLQNLVNKIGDPQQKVVSKVMYCITQLLRVHPNMKLTVMDEIEKLLFRPNINQRTQYYCICLLSQFIFQTKDQDIARNMINIYFSFFKALIKMGEIDSRIMGALLMGVKRAHPYAKLDSGSMVQHIDTLYKLVHLTPFNIAVHALALLQEISNDTDDRFYSALYRKLLDPKLGVSCHHAMLINLIYKSLSKDSNINRVKAFIKRLLQVCLYSPVPLLCGFLYMLSQLISRRKVSLFTDYLEAQNEALISYDFDEKDEDEKYVDVDKEVEEQSKLGETEVGEDVDEEEKKPLRGWLHCEMNRPSAKTWSLLYDPFARNPAFSKAEKTVYMELLTLSKHFHPTVALFAQKILNQETITYTGDPLIDFTISKFLERFVFKNPKIKSSEEDRGPDPQLALRKYYQPSGLKSLQVTSSDYLNSDIKDIPVDEIFLYRYLKDRYRPRSSDDDDNASVTSEEFMDLIDKHYGGKVKKDFDFMDELEYSMKNKSKKKGKLDDDKEDSEEEEEEDFDDDDDDDYSEDDDEVMDFDENVEDFDGEIDFDEALGNKPKKFKVQHSIKNKQKKKNNIENLFAPAEEFAEILEDAGSSKHKPGMAHSLSTKDNAAPKQLDWEKNRDRWVQDANSKKRKWKGNPKKFKKRRT